ncbi:hypothetical protein FKP32DRAFT_263167 [Trametes sanguinea]|nr:hypothetical protein FKP32DRAFT_263167 [Trametes sanguinea]
MHAFIQAILASFIPLLPVIFQSFKLDWNISLPVKLAPRFLSPRAVINLSVDDYDWGPDTGQFLHIESSEFGHLDTKHPIFESLAAIFHHLRLGSASSSSSRPNLAGLLFLVGLLAYYFCSMPSLFRRHLFCRQRPHEVGSLDGLATSAYLWGAAPPFLSARERDLYLRLQRSASITSSRLIPPKLDPVASLLLSWDEEVTKSLWWAIPSIGPALRLLAYHSLLSLSPRPSYPRVYRFEVSASRIALNPADHSVVLSLRIKLGPSQPRTGIDFSGMSRARG